MSCTREGDGDDLNTDNNNTLFFVGACRNGMDWTSFSDNNKPLSAAMFPIIMYGYETYASSSKVDDR
jgi:hypothetical protein